MNARQMCGTPSKRSSNNDSERKKIIVSGKN